jgi:hypothetical protein
VEVNTWLTYGTTQNFGFSRRSKNVSGPFKLPVDKIFLPENEAASIC